MGYYRGKLKENEKTIENPVRIKPNLVPINHMIGK
jgi:hypothetical protein